MSIYLLPFANWVLYTLSRSSCLYSQKKRLNGLGINRVWVFRLWIKFFVITINYYWLWRLAVDEEKIFVLRKISSSVLKDVWGSLGYNRFSLEDFEVRTKINERKNSEKLNWGSKFIEENGFDLFLYLGELKTMAEEKVYLEI